MRMVQHAERYLPRTSKIAEQTGMAGDYMCYLFNERNETWIPWGPNSKLWIFNDTSGKMSQNENLKLGRELKQDKPTDRCDDGIRSTSEACDDGNSEDHDGCSSVCTVECGFSCAGQTPDLCTTICGDGMQAMTEECDDGNLENHDGCSSACSLESGYLCNTTACAASTCKEVCGNAIKTKGEMCDDGNTDANDGCSSSCTVECGYTCDMDEPDLCSSFCGDSILAGDEACDDGALFAGPDSTCQYLDGGVIRSGTCPCDFGSGPLGIGLREGVLSDGSGTYDNNADCRWLITAPGGEVSLQFSSFSTELNYDEVYCA